MKTIKVIEKKGKSAFNEYYTLGSMRKIFEETIIFYKCT